MAGMMRDRIVSEEMRQNMPETTVADDVLGAAQQMGQPQGMGQPQDQFAQMRQPVEGQPQMAMMAEGGLASIPFDDGMFDYAGGGIVAFSNGGRPFDTTRRILEEMGLITEDGQFIRPYQTEREKRLMAELQAQTAPTPSIAPIAPVDDSAEMAKFARQAQGTGVPMTPPPPPPPPPGPQPAPGPAALGVSGTDLMTRLNKAYGVGADGALSTLPIGMQDIFKERAEAERLAGVDKDFFKNEARNIVKQRDELKGDKKEAANMRLIEAGLRIMGGESPYAFVNIGKGASEALKGFADDVKDIQKTKREYDKSERELRTAEQLYARTQSDSALKTVEERRARNQEQQIRFAEAQNKLAIDLDKIAVQREGVRAQTAAAAKPSQFQEMYAAEKEDPERFKRFRESFASKDNTLQQQKLADDALAKDTEYIRLSNSNKPENKKRANDIKQEIYARYGVGAGAGGADPLGLFIR
jgi:chemotaxis protein histidine kinase CheA